MKQQKSKEFWTYNNEELCSSEGVLTIAEQINGGVRPSRTSLRKWLAQGLPFKTHISKHYIFSVEAVKKFFLCREKPRKQWGYRQEVSNA